MSIWFGDFPLDYVNDRGKNCLIEHLGIELLEAGDDYLTARMPVDNRTRNPARVLHGGASVALAETLGTWAAAFCVDPAKHHCVGLEINANHLRPAADGFVNGMARSVHRGKDHAGLGGSIDRRQRQAGLYLTPHRGGSEHCPEVLGDAQ